MLAIPYALAVGAYHAVRGQIEMRRRATFSTIMTVFVFLFVTILGIFGMMMVRQAYFGSVTEVVGVAASTDMIIEDIADMLINNKQMLAYENRRVGGGGRKEAGTLDITKVDGDEGIEEWTRSTVPLISESYAIKVTVTDLVKDKVWESGKIGRPDTPPYGWRRVGSTKRYVTLSDDRNPAKLDVELNVWGFAADHVLEVHTKKNCFGDPRKIGMLTVPGTESEGGQELDRTLEVKGGTYHIFFYGADTAGIKKGSPNADEVYGKIMVKYITSNGEDYFQGTKDCKEVNNQNCKITGVAATSVISAGLVDSDCSDNFGKVLVALTGVS